MGPPKPRAARAKRIAKPDEDPEPSSSSSESLSEGKGSESDRSQDVDLAAELLRKAKPKPEGLVVGINEVRRPRQCRLRSNSAPQTMYKARSWTVCCVFGAGGRSVKLQKDTT